MNVSVTDCQSVGETEASLLTLANQGALIGSLVLRNLGANKLNYRFQTKTGDADWVDADESGTALYNTVVAGAAKTLSYTFPSATKVRIQVSASGGTVVSFSLTRQVARASGGKLPLVASV